MATAKQTKAAPATTSNVTVKSKVMRGVNDRFIRSFGTDGKPTPLPKVPPQVKVIVDGVEAAGKRGILRSELVTNITPTLITRQPPERIISYYEKKIVELGLVTIQRSASAPVAAAPVAVAA